MDDSENMAIVLVLNYLESDTFFPRMCSVTVCGTSQIGLSGLFHGFRKEVRRDIAFG